MTNLILQCVLYLALATALAVPLGIYIHKVMNGERVFLSRLLVPCEKGLYRLLNIDPAQSMGWKSYAACVLSFSALGFALLFIMLLAQGVLPLNPAGLGATSWHLAFNTAVSFVTNTNWQAYSGESTLSYFTQMIGLTVQNFVSAAVGLAVLFAFIRGLIGIQGAGLGNFWQDVTRAMLYVLLPLSLVISVALAWQGVPQNFSAYKTTPVMEVLGSAAAEQIIPMGPMASQIAIKQLGSNGGGYLGTNSAHPLENPTPLSNLLELLAIVLIPMALCFSLGRAVKDRRQGIALFIAMFVLLTASLAAIAYFEQSGTAQLAQGGRVDLSAIQQAGGNMEGKETRFGIAASASWTAFTTAVANGSVNAMLDSFTPLGGLVPLLLMQLGEVVFGGVGCGLYGLLAFAVLTVFIAGLMVGRTPEYLGKKIEPFEMKMAVVVCLTTPAVTLIGSGLAAVLPQVLASVQNAGPHGFAELLYAFSSAGGNNGSAFAGFNANTPFLNVSLGLVMLVARFAPIAAVLAMAESLGRKKKVPAGAGTLSTCNAMFVFLLIGVVLLIGALSFLPALALGPIAEYLQ